jgi:inner membrane protease ATP23
MEECEKKEIWECEKLVVAAVESSPLVSLLIRALSVRGCPVNLLRHVACERCGPGLAGGYDRLTNQIVICSNYTTRPQEIQQTLRQH